MIKLLFKNAIIGAKYPEDSESRLDNGLEVHIVNVDGETYHFSYLERFRELRSGHVWSPNKGTEMSRLVGIGNNLIELAKDKFDSVNLSEEFKAEILNLTKDLKINDR